jgi:hypothetical protein
MAQLAFLADEHLPRACVRAHRGSGYTDERVGDDYPGGIGDEALLELGVERTLVVVTNDRDLVALAQEHPHAGVVSYTDQGMNAGGFVGAIRSIDAQISPTAAEEEISWLTQWVDATG